MHKDISAANRVVIRQEARSPHVKVRFVDMSEYDEKVSSDVGVYYSVETNYRLFLFSELFSAYDRMIYLDCDTVVTGDISRLFDMPLNGSAIGAAADVGVRVLSYTKRAVFFEKKPYNIDNYISQVLDIPEKECYFNAGVLLIDLKKCRGLVTFEKVTEILHGSKLFYNDQDVLKETLNKSTVEKANR